MDEKGLGRRFVYQFCVEIYSDVEVGGGGGGTPSTWALWVCTALKDMVFGLFWSEILTILA